MNGAIKGTIDRMTFAIAVAAIAVGAAGCSTMKKSAKQVAIAFNIIDEPRIPAIKDTPADYRAAVTEIEESRFTSGLEQLSAFLVRQPTSPWTQAAIFNQGRALEGLERWTEASERYRDVIRATGGRAPRLQAYALYRLSFCFEALNRYPEVVATLNDLMSLANQLDREVAEAELPARLAGAYASVGNHEMAEKFYRTAEAGIAHLKNQKEMRDLPSWLPKTLYFMGSMSLRNVNWDDFEASLRPLPRAQTYLLQAAELGLEPWSSNAVSDLTGFYRRLWTAIDKAPLPRISDPLIARRKVQQRQWDLAALVFENLEMLKAYRMPGDAAPSEQAKKLFLFADQLENQIQKLYAQRPEGEGQTPESVARGQNVRGRVIEPNDALERLYKQSPVMRENLPAKVPATLPATHIPESEPGGFEPSLPSSEDPNL
jgi:tetratricopeptide (TPR) repeat protein